MGKLIRHSVPTSDLIKFDVAEDGIYQPIIAGSGVYSQMLIPREVFVEAYNKYIVEENRKKKLSYKLSNWLKNLSSNTIIKFNPYIKTKETKKSKEN